MKRDYKHLLITGIVIIVLGAAITVIGLFMYDYLFNKTQYK